MLKPTPWCHHCQKLCWKFLLSCGCIKFKTHIFCYALTVWQHDLAISLACGWHAEYSLMWCDFMSMFSQASSILCCCSPLVSGDFWVCILSNIQLFLHLSVVLMSFLIYLIWKKSAYAAFVKQYWDLFVKIWQGRLGLVVSQIPEFTVYVWWCWDRDIYILYFTFNISVENVGDEG